MCYFISIFTTFLRGGRRDLEPPAFRVKVSDTMRSLHIVAYQRIIRTGKVLEFLGDDDTDDQTLSMMIID